MDENLIVGLEKKGIVTATFRRLEPAKKQIIYQAALEAFAKEIFHNVSLDEISAGAEISKGSLIQYFGQKDRLLLFVSEIYLNAYQAFWDDYFSREFAVRSKDRILQYLRARLDFWEKDRTGFRFCLKMHYENDYRLGRDFIESIFRLRQRYLRGIISRGMETGEIRHDRNADEIFFVLSALTSKLDLAYRDILISPRDKTDLGNLIEKVTALLFDGIGV